MLSPRISEGTHFPIPKPMSDYLPSFFLSFLPKLTGKMSTIVLILSICNSNEFMFTGHHSFWENSILICFTHFLILNLLIYYKY
jgi:hypothetical protein